MPRPTDHATPARGPARSRSRARESGQVVVIFAGAMLVLVALCAVVVDVAWYWTNNLRMQRAADAAALAGVVWLPGNTGTAYSVAIAEAAKNGYPNGVGGYTITPVQDPTNTRRLNVTIAGPVGTFFARAVGLNSWPARRTARADYVLPVPMGSPDNYYGVGYYVKPETTTTSHTTYSHSSGDSGWLAAGAAASGGSWADPVNATVLANGTGGNDNQYATEDTDNQAQAWNTFRLLNTTGPPPADPRPRIPLLNANQTLAIDAIEVRLTDVGLGGSGNTADCRIGVDLNWNAGGGSSWSDQVLSGRVTSRWWDGDNPSTDLTVGSNSNMTAWGTHDWSREELGNTSLQVRLTWVRADCAATRTVKLDLLEIRVHYTVTTATTTTTTTTVLVEDALVPPPPGQAAITRPQKFWGAMQSQGAPSIQGDAFMTKYDRRTSILNAVGGSDPDAYYDYTNYYNYAVEIPAGGGGNVWVFDPGFCDATTTAGTGENWTVGGDNGYSTRQPVSAYFDLWDTQETMLDLSDDTLVVGTGSTYRRLSGQDHVIYDLLGVSTTYGIADCSSASGHYGWVQIASGLAAGTYRIHSYSTDTSSLNDQNNTTALNAFAFYASSTSGSPRIYGLGAMEAYVRLPRNQVSEFYLAQIDAVHAGKTVVINLWDPGDTGNLSASLRILAPTGTGFTPAQFDYQGTPGAHGAKPCATRSGTGVYSVVTNAGYNNSYYNGCWLTIEVQLPSDYSAPVDPASGEDGWWKIQYTMGNQSGSGATDLTTWKVDIRGNPVHLITP
ncbi:MAG: pilus assembly protein TadG-related protein [Candidatus Limnocylindrales bacterium]